MFMLGLVVSIIGFSQLYPALRTDRIVLEIQEINNFFYLLKGVSQGKNYLLDSIEIHINEPADSINRVTFVHDELVQLKAHVPNFYFISTENLGGTLASHKPFSFLFEFGKEIEKPKFSKCFAIDSRTKKLITCKIAQEWYENFSNAITFVVSIALSIIIGFFLAGIIYWLIKIRSKPKRKLVHVFKPNEEE